MREIGNVAGTVMKKDTPLVKFVVERGEPIEVELLQQTDLPFEFRCLEPKAAIMEFLDDRVVPETRIGLDKVLKEAGIPYFSMDAILRYGHGVACDDQYWIRFPGETITWIELLKEKGLENNKHFNY